MDAFPMLLRCWIGQQPIGGSELVGPDKCLNCSEVTHFLRKYCALCAIRHELGVIKLAPVRGWYEY